MDFSNIKAIKIPEGVVTKITALGRVIWSATVAIKNWVKYSTINDGKTIYNNDLGYKDGYRIRSGGTEGVLSDATCTGFIPLKNGDTLRISPAFTGKNTQNAINFADGSFTNLGQITDNGTGYGICSGKVNLYKTQLVNGVSTLTLTANHDANIRYVRITNYKGSTSSGANMIITVNEEIE